MKLINLLLLFLPVLGYSQVVPSEGTTTQSLQYYNGSTWVGSRYSTETKKGVVKTPVQVMDSGIKVEVFETRDTLYKCPVSYIQYFNASGQQETFTNCTFDKVVTCRTYRFYIINEEGKKEYLSMDISKNK